MSIKFAPLAAALLVGAALSLSACASETAPGASETPSTPDDSGSQQAEAVWLDEGRFIGVVTWGSSSCVPVAGEVTATGQDISATFEDLPGADGAELACTADFAPRATVLGTPVGVDPHKDASLSVTYVEQEFRVEIDGDDDLKGVPGESTEYLPSAAWLHDDAGILLLTWGSSTCAPIVESVEETETEVIATFATQDGPCTMDMVPRATLIGLSSDNDDRVLKLIGDNLDGTVQVVG